MTFEIEQELRKGERVLWSGHPKQGICLRPSDAFAIPFSLLWCGFVVFWEFSVFKANTPFFFRLWGIPFVIAGLYLVFGRFFADAWTRGRTAYAVTTERILIVTGFRSRETKSLQLRTLSDVTLTEGSDGRGTIRFGPQHPMAKALPPGWPGGAKYSAPAFDMIDAARSVYEVIGRAQRDAG